VVWFLFFVCFFLKACLLCFVINPTMMQTSLLPVQKDIRRPAADLLFLIPCKGCCKSAFFIRHSFDNNPSTDFPCSYSSMPVDHRNALVLHTTV